MIVYARGLSKSYGSKMNTIRFFLFLLFYIKSIDSAKILAMMTCASGSHHIWNSAITNELARRGHDVTYFSPNKDANPPANVRQIHAENVYENIYTEMDIQQSVERQRVWHMVSDFDQFGYLNCKFIIESKGFEKMLEIVRKEKFDLVILEISNTECLYPLADELKGVPIVGATAYGASDVYNYVTGNPEMFAIKAHTYMQIANNMTLLERMQNFAVYLYTMYDRFYNFLPKQLELAKTRFPNVKDIHGVLDRLSLVLVNIHFSIDEPLPAVPALINVGGLHIKPPQPLPDDLQKFLDESTHGAILLSLGSNLKSSQLSEEKRKILLDSFRELAPIRILWKFEKDLVDKPSNVLIKKWLPQSDILGHPNLKLFFTHSGLLSIQEAIYHGKPITGMPFYGDQLININRCVREGLGEKIDYLTLDKDNLTRTIKKVWTDPKYKEKMEHLSRIFKDRPQTPLETAMYWIEYVIKHKGAPHLKCASLNLSWYQNNLLDVVLVLFVSFVIALLTVRVVLKKLVKCLLSKQQKLKKQ